MAEVTATKAMPVNETLEMEMPDSITRREQGRTHLSNSKIITYLGKSKVLDQLCNNNNMFVRVRIGTIMVTG